MAGKQIKEQSGKSYESFLARVEAKNQASIKVKLHGNTYSLVSGKKQEQNKTSATSTKTIKATKTRTRTKNTPKTDRKPQKNRPENSKNRPETSKNRP